MELAIGDRVVGYTQRHVFTNIEPVACFVSVPGNILDHPVWREIRRNTLPKFEADLAALLEFVSSSFRLRAESVFDNNFIVGAYGDNGKYIQMVLGQLPEIGQTFWIFNVSEVDFTAPFWLQYLSALAAEKRRQDASGWGSLDTIASTVVNHYIWSSWAAKLRGWVSDRR